MAIGITKINAATSLSGASFTLAYSGAVTAGSTLVAGGFNYNTGTPASPAISDTVNGAWTVTQYATWALDGNIEVWLATRENSAAGTPTVTWDPNTSADGSWFIAEITGASTPTSVDVIPTPHNTSVDEDTPFIASGTLAQANELLLAIVTGGTNQGTVTIVGDLAGGYTELVNNGDNATSQMGHAQYKIVASTASDQADWTFTDAPGAAVAGKVAILISVKEAAALPVLSAFLGEPATSGRSPLT